MGALPLVQVLASPNRRRNQHHASPTRKRPRSPVTVDGNTVHRHWRSRFTPGDRGNRRRDGHCGTAGPGEDVRRALRGTPRKDHCPRERIPLTRGPPVPLGTDADRRGSGPRPRERLRGVQPTAVTTDHGEQGDRRPATGLGGLFFHRAPGKHGARPPLSLSAGLLTGGPPSPSGALCPRVACRAAAAHGTRPLGTRPRRTASRCGRVRVCDDPRGAFTGYVCGRRTRPTHGTGEGRPPSGGRRSRGGRLTPQGTSTASGRPAG